MTIITKGFFVVSVILISIGCFLGREAKPLLDGAIQLSKSVSYGYYVYFFLTGVPLAFLNILESKYIWSRIFNSGKIDLLGISAGFLLGILSLYYV